MNVLRLFFGKHMPSGLLQSVDAEFREVCELFSRIEYDIEEEWVDFKDLGPFDINRVRERVEHFKKVIGVDHERLRRLSHDILMMHAQLHGLPVKGVDLKKLEESGDADLVQLEGLVIQLIGGVWKRQVELSGKLEVDGLKKEIQIEHKLLMHIKDLLIPLKSKLNSLDNGIEDVSFLDQFPATGHPPAIPNGWTYLIHGTNLLRPQWSHRIVQLFTQDIFLVRNDLSTVSVEMSQRDAALGFIGTTTSYSSYPRPAGMSDHEYHQRNRPVVIKVVFFQDYVSRVEGRRYLEVFPPQYRDEIWELCKQFYTRLQGGRHPFVPSGTVLLKLAHTFENGVHVIYYIPRKVIPFYKMALG